MITLKSIRGAAVAATYKKGEQVYISGKVGGLKRVEEGDTQLIQAEVAGTSRGARYEVFLLYQGKTDTWSSYTCSCPAFRTYPKMCKHCVAVAMKLYYMENSPTAKNGGADLKGTSLAEAGGERPAAGGSLAAGDRGMAAGSPDQTADSGVSREADDKNPAAGSVSPATDSKSPAGSGGRQPSGESLPAKKRAQVKLRATDEALTDIIYASSMKEKARYLQPELTGKVELIPVFEKSERYWSLEFKIGAGQKYVLKNITQLVEAVWSHDWVEYGKKLAFYHEWSVFTPRSQEILKVLEQYILQEKNTIWNYHNRGSYYGYYGYEETLTKRKLGLSDSWLVKFAEVLADGSYPLNGPGNMKPELEIKKGNPMVKVQLIARPEGGYRLSVPPAEAFIGQDRICIRAGSSLYVCSREFSEPMKMIGSLFTGYRTEYAIHPDDASAFCASVLPILKQYTSCDTPQELVRYEPAPLKIQVYLDRQEELITARAVCSYGETSYNLLEEITVSRLHRDFEKEQGLLKVLEQFFVRIDKRQLLFLLPEEDEDKLYRLLDEGIGVLQQLGEVLISDRLKKLQIVRPPRVSVGIGFKAGLLDVDIQAERLPLDQIEAILQGYRRKKKFYRLPDGSFLRLEDNGLSAVAELAEGLDLKGKQLAEGHLTVPGYRSFYLDQILRENGGDIQVDRSQRFKALLRDMKNIEDSDFEVPKGLKATLRPYQKFGFRWMMTLQKLTFGGILADDMGLGKTIQTIAYLLAQKQAAQGQQEGAAKKIRYLGLVVCPASLVYNWESEIARFAPSLSAVTVTGSAAVRKGKLLAGEGDVLLTSYDLLKRDVEVYQDIRFDNVIIDEAQNIKNHTTQAAKAVKILDSAQRFALTGTPIENTLSELWSIFDFLMPGILDRYKHFRETYEQPITADQDERVAARLKKMIRPYILRRLKGDVLKELPDKIEKIVYSRMGEEQKALYDANLQKLLASLQSQSQEEFSTGKLQILAELTKLRQLCCDPSMVYEDYKGAAAKVETCLELIRSGIAAGNQILLFSQFTTALTIIQKRLEQEKIPCYVLTGSTPKEKRARLVEAFGRDKTPVFLISLKAGGTGLNLTAATMVIHFDPWWNMAAQDQATDRAHRIGQRQVVTVYKLLMKDTLEEKIHKLQEQKARLSDEIISEGSIRDTLATKEELFAILSDHSL